MPLFSEERDNYLTIALELGSQDLYDFWEEFLDHLKSGKGKQKQMISHMEMVKHLVREIVLGLEELHQGSLF